MFFNELTPRPIWFTILYVFLVCLSLPFWNYHFQWEKVLVKSTSNPIDHWWHNFKEKKALMMPVKKITLKLPNYTTKNSSFFLRICNTPIAIY